MRINRLWLSGAITIIILYLFSISFFFSKRQQNNDKFEKEQLLDSILQEQKQQQQNEEHFLQQEKDLEKKIFELAVRQQQQQQQLQPQPQSTQKQPPQKQQSLPNKNDNEKDIYRRVKRRKINEKTGEYCYSPKRNYKKWPIRVAGWWGGEFPDCDIPCYGGLGSAVGDVTNDDFTMPSAYIDAVAHGNLLSCLTLKFSFSESDCSVHFRRRW
jgi:hypothetical protein